MEIKTKLRLITALHIGSGDDTMEIGGIDSSVVKREIYVNEDGTINYNGKGKKITEPYIPGSSLKGKIRSLLEHAFGLIDKQRMIFAEEDDGHDSETIQNDRQRKKRLIGKPVDSNLAEKLDGLDKKKAELIIKLFGESAGSGDTKNIKITRAIFRDCFLTEEFRKLYLDGKIKLSEEKAENTINRVSVTANPRFLERVPSGVEFDFEVVIRQFDEDNNLPLQKTLELGLKLLENDALGGGGSRGNGKVDFEVYDNKSKDIKTLLSEIEDEISRS